MNRRNFLSTLLGIVIARKAAPSLKNLEWDLNRFDLVPENYVPKIITDPNCDKSMIYFISNPTGKSDGWIHNMFVDNPRSYVVIDEISSVRTVIEK